MKKILLGLLVMGLISCSSEKEKKGELIDFIPEDASVVVRSTSIKTLDSDLKNNSFLSAFSKTALYSYFSNDINFVDYLNPVSEVLIAFNSSEANSQNYTFITRQHPDLFILDSLRDKMIETLKYEDFTFQKVTTDEGILFSNITDSVFIASNSEENLRNILNQRTQSTKKKKENTFKRIYGAGAQKNLTVFINGKHFPDLLQQFFPNMENSFHNFTSWMALDTDINPDEIKINGIAIAQDTVPQILNLFKGTTPQRNEIAKVTPTSASGFVSYTYNDFETLSANIADFSATTRSDKNSALFQSLNEIGIIYKGEEKIIALHAIDGNITRESLLGLQSNLSEFRGIQVQKLNDSSVFNNAFKPLISNTNPQYFAKLEDFFVFTENQSTLEGIITDFLNETALGNQPFYEEHTAQMSSEASILLVSLNANFTDKVSSLVEDEHSQQIKNIRFENQPMAAIQFVYDNNFAHVNGIVKQTRAGKRSTGVSQQFSINLDNALLTRPQFFTNHLTKGKDIVVQDVSNKLYLISSNGRVLWTKQLEGPILGEIQEVDLLKNGRFQLAFATKNNFYTLDRNGKDVSPFPLKFRDDITQPLAVFDYDNNRDYRFIITQGTEILMYDNKGKTVSGFTFKKAGSKVVLPPQHIRISNKDYLLIAEESGKLHILHRTGNSRINVSEKFEFSNSPIFQEKEQFVFVDKNNSKINIDTNGKVTKSSLGSDSGTQFTVRGNTIVTLDENILKINSIRVELPYGVYTNPQISISNRRVLISITDLQQQRSYVYNSQGELLPNFPVYGTSVMEIGDATSNGRPNAVVKGEDNGVVLYELN